MVNEIDFQYKLDKVRNMLADSFGLIDYISRKGFIRSKFSIYLFIKLSNNRVVIRKKYPQIL